MDTASILDQHTQDLSNLPAELAHLLTELGEKDMKYYETRKRIQQRDNQLHRYIKQFGSLQTNNKESQLYQLMNQDFETAQRIQEEKCLLANTALFLISKHLTKLEKDIEHLENEGLLAPAELLEQEVSLTSALSSINSISLSSSSSSNAVQLTTPRGHKKQSQRKNNNNSNSVSRNSTPAAAAAAAATAKTSATPAIAGANIGGLSGAGAAASTPGGVGSVLARRDQDSTTMLPLLQASSPGAMAGMVGPGSAIGQGQGQGQVSVGGAGLESPLSQLDLNNSTNTTMSNSTKLPPHLSRRKGGSNTNTSPNVVLASSPTHHHTHSHHDVISMAPPGSATGAAATGEEDELYCFCRQVSFGNMIACDNDNCKFEWFHYDCVGLKEPPQGTWYCPDCAKIMGNRKGRKKKAVA